MYKLSPGFIIYLILEVKLNTGGLLNIVRQKTLYYIPPLTNINQYVC
jgi:hypothetical protein